MIDTHTHLHEPDFDSIREEIITDMQRKQMTGVLVGTDLDTSRSAIRLAEQYPQTFMSSVGIHPHEAEHTTEEDLAKERELIEESHVQGIGEAGLDYAGHTTSELKTKQQYLFRHQIDMAREYGLPLIIHTRDAWEDTYEILHAHTTSDMPIVLHCFTGNVEWARRFLDAFPNLMISFSGIVTFRKNVEDIQQAARSVPQDRMLAETDSPYLAPEPYRGKQNDTRNLTYVIQKLAELQGVSFSAIDSQLDANARTIFGKSK
ncbi:MAG: TatD family hydrolase [Candidatus Paceibacteria bacterium]